VLFKIKKWLFKTERCFNPTEMLDANLSKSCREFAAIGAKAAQNWYINENIFQPVD
jgi:hypothetical protein